MTRIESIEFIMTVIEKDDIVIASNGMISREVYKVKDRPLNFYMQGSMGCALGIGLGIALHSKFNVHVISGDGAVLMSMGTLALHEWLVKNKDMKNLQHWVLDNKAYATTGGKTCSDSVVYSASHTEVICVTPENSDAPRIPLSPLQITERFQNAINALKEKQTTGR